MTRYNYIFTVIYFLKLTWHKIQPESRNFSFKKKSFWICNSADKLTNRDRTIRTLRERETNREAQLRSCHQAFLDRDRRLNDRNVKYRELQTNSVSNTVYLNQTPTVFLKAATWSKCQNFTIIVIVENQVIDLNFLITVGAFCVT